jgi:hypothetical protein
VAKAKKWNPWTWALVGVGAMAATVAVSRAMQPKPIAIPKRRPVAPPNRPPPPAQAPTLDPTSSWFFFATYICPGASSNPADAYEIVRASESMFLAEGDAGSLAAMPYGEVWWPGAGSPPYVTAGECGPVTFRWDEASQAWELWRYTSNPQDDLGEGVETVVEEEDDSWWPF